MRDTRMTLAAPSQHLPVAGSGSGASAAVRAGWRGLWREPLLHFAVLAAAIFGADRVLHPPSKSEKVIVITPEVRQQIIDAFDEDKQVKPSDEELRKMLDFWVATEVLFREGKAMGLDRNDEMIKARVAHKLQLLIFSDIDVGNPTESQAQEWFAKHRDRFDTPETFSFYMAPAGSEAKARDYVAQIAAGNEPESLQDTARAFQSRPAESLTAPFGDAFAGVLRTLPRGQWQAVQARDGWYVVRVDSSTAAVKISLEDARQAVMEGWKTDERRRRANEAVARLKTSYTVRDEATP